MLSPHVSLQFNSVILNLSRYITTSFLEIIIQRNDNWKHRLNERVSVDSLESRRRNAHVRSCSGLSNRPDSCHLLKSRLKKLFNVRPRYHSFHDTCPR